MGEHAVNDLDDDEGDVQRGCGREGRAECAGCVGMNVAMMTVAVTIVSVIVVSVIVASVIVASVIVVWVTAAGMIVPAGFGRRHAVTAP